MSVLRADDGIDAYEIVYSVAIVGFRDGIGQARCRVGRLLHLCGIDTAMQVHQVAGSDVRPYLFHLNVIPDGERVVVAVDEQYRTALFLRGVEIVLSHVTAKGPPAPVVVIPILAGHLYGDG